MTLTPLQREVARIVGDAAEVEDFAFAGAAPLIAEGIVSRTTMDLDLFTVSAAGVDRALPAIEDALRSAGMQVRRVRVAHGSARPAASVC